MTAISAELLKKEIGLVTHN